MQLFLENDGLDPGLDYLTSLDSRYKISAFMRLGTLSAQYLIILNKVSAKFSSLVSLAPVFSLKQIPVLPRAGDFLS